MKDQSDPQDLLDAAASVRLNAYAPYSDFQVGAAVRAASGKIYAGCNVENIAYPVGTCAEAGAIAAMIAAGDRQITEVAVIAAGTNPITPCGGCRQKLQEFATGDVKVTMATTNGAVKTMTIAELLPGAFDTSQME